MFELIGIVFTGICTVLGNYFIYIKRSKADLAESARKEQKQNDRLDSIERKLDEHNKYAEKFSDIKADNASIKSDIRLMTRDISYLKEEFNDVKASIKIA